MRRRGLRKATIGFHFDRMNEVGKFDGILNEKDRDIIADQIPIALFRVKLDGEAANIARGIGRTGPACHG